MRALHWFRADLRLADNTALYHAMQESSELMTVFILTSKTWQRHDAASCKIQFILNNLQSLSESLAKKGIPLLIRETDYFSECPQLLEQLCDECKINALYFNKQYELDELRRDKLVLKQLQTKVVVKSYDDQCILAPGLVKSKQEQPLQIFTPFKKTWLTIADEISAWQSSKMPNKIFQTTIKSNPIPKLTEWKTRINMELWPAGEQAAGNRLKQFCSSQLSTYHEDRDFPCKNSTSQLSPYLAQGVISARQCIMQMMNQHQVNDFKQCQQDKGASIWLSELIWRDFYKHIVFFYPQVCMYKAFRSKTDKLPWNNDPPLYLAWCEGRTGYPLVDAAMRQLNQTGWMHNRLRMVVAMFLSKTLFLDWRLGERYFMQNLIDGDFAANNGGWQWSASTGTDAVPYFRIFNPTTQSQRFDPNGEFIKQFCPELSKLDHKSIHEPFQYGIKDDQINYPKPIVSYGKMREKVINLFKEI